MIIIAVIIIIIRIRAPQGFFNRIFHKVNLPHLIFYINNIIANLSFNQKFSLKTI